MDVGVSFPDLLWAVLVFARREEVAVDGSGRSPNRLIFRKHPISTSQT